MLWVALAEVLRHAIVAQASLGVAPLAPRGVGRLAPPTVLPEAPPEVHLLARPRSSLHVRGAGGADNTAEREASGALGPPRRPPRQPTCVHCACSLQPHCTSRLSPRLTLRLRRRLLRPPLLPVRLPTALSRNSLLCPCRLSRRPARPLFSLCRLQPPPQLLEGSSGASKDQHLLTSLRSQAAGRRRCGDATQRRDCRR